MITQVATTITGASAINIDSLVEGGEVQSESNELDLVTASNGRITITGDQDLTLTTSTADPGGGTGLTITAANFGAAVDVTGTDGTDTITAGDADDTVRSSLGGDAITLGAGEDVYVLEDVGDATSEAMERIADFTSGEDALSFASILNGNDSTFFEIAVDVSTADTLEKALNLATRDADGTANSVVSYFQFDGDTYVVANNGAEADFSDSADAVIQLAGSVELTAEDVVLA